ncbi:MAG: hypothetical protein HQM14_16575 [SAR324 cluster bacterium]|nr:hypothetical protein [SAR324 cluster bacterium]
MWKSYSIGLLVFSCLLLTVGCEKYDSYGDCLQKKMEGKGLLEKPKMIAECTKMKADGKF